MLYCSSFVWLSDDVCSLKSDKRIAGFKLSIDTLSTIPFKLILKYLSVYCNTLYGPS